MGSAPTPPAAPDPNAIASAQSGANIQSASSQAALNNVSQYTPWGNLQYSQTGTGPNGIPTYSATQTTNPGQQAILNQGEQFAQNIAPMYSGAPNTLPTVQGAEQQYMKAMQPFFDQQTNTTQSGLRNQGFVPGDQGYDTTMQGLQNSQQNQVSQNLPAWNNMAIQNYELPLQTAQQMLSPSQAPFATTPQTGVSPTDVTGAYGINQQAQEYNYGQQNANYQQMLGGLFSIPSAVAGGWAKGGFQMPAAAAAA